MVEIVVIDTNVFVSALLSSSGASREVLRLCLIGALIPVMGNKLFLEFEDLFNRSAIFQESPISGADRADLFEGFLSVCRWVNVFFLWRPNLPDEGDNQVLELAVASGASAIITHNVSDFEGELKFPVQVLSPGQYLRIRR